MKSRQCRLSILCGGWKKYSQLSESPVAADSIWSAAGRAECAKVSHMLRRVHADQLQTGFQHGPDAVRQLQPGGGPLRGPQGGPVNLPSMHRGGQTSFCIIPQSGGFGNRKFSHCSHSGPPGWGLLDNWPYCTAPLRTTVSAGMGPPSSSAIFWFHWLISASVTYPSSMSFSRVWVMVG